ncbi:hypothetical protein Musp01_02820 [Muricauda sp. NBRC 101325]|nr:hypothetical protein Musp01_02820 [Muricauda sp. NBRC 101325]
MILSSCSGEDGLDGAPGKNGDPGDPGLNGEPGTPGQNGIDAIPFTELTQFGSVVLEMEGTRTDGMAFTDSTSFRFTPTDLEFALTSHLEYQDTPDGTLYQFYVVRFLSMPDSSYQNTYFSFNVNMLHPGADNMQLKSFSYSLTKYAVVGDDNRYFILTQTHNNQGPEIQNLQITDVTFDATNNHLLFSFSYTIVGTANATGHPLLMSGIADVYLLEKIQ